MIVTTNTILESLTRPGEETQASALGTLGGANIVLQTRILGIWYDVPNGNFTVPFEVIRSNGPGTALRLVVSAATASSNIELNLTALRES